MKNLLLLMLLIIPFSLYAANKKRTKLFVIQEAYVYDSNGDGGGDSISVTLELSAESDALTTMDVSSLAFSYDGNSYIEVAQSEIEIESDTKFTFLMDSDFSSTISLRIHTPEGEVLGSAIDRVGPVLDEARVLIGDDFDRDTLFITLSENISESTPEQFTVCLNNSAEIDEIECEHHYIVSDRVVQAIFAKGSLMGYDSISISPESGITDSYGNKPSYLSKRVPLQIEIVTPIGEKRPTTYTPPFSLSGSHMKVNSSTPYEVEVFAANGALIGVHKEQKKELDLSSFGLASGVYQLRLKQGEVQYKQTFVVR